MVIESKISVEEYFQEMSLVMEGGDTLTCETNEEGGVCLTLRGYEGTVLNTFNSFTGEYLIYWS